MPDASTVQEAEQQSGGGRAGFWLEEIQRAGKREKKWRDEGKGIVERYRNDKKKSRSLNILWANTEIIKPAVLSRTPQPDVRQRFMVHNPVEKMAAEILEKGLKFCADDPDYGFMANLESARDDMLLPGRGVVRVVYERDIQKNPLELNAGGVMPEADGYDTDEETGQQTPYREEIANQEVYCKHIYWEDYREGDARCWEDVPWIAYRHTMTKGEGKKQFGEKFDKVPLPLTPRGDEVQNTDKTTQDPESPLARAIVWEVWDKETESVIWVAEGYKEGPLDEYDDPLHLENFYPQPDPLYGVRTTDSRIPVPEFRIYKDQADELDDISLRIKRLISACKVRGIYAALMKEAANLLNGDENELYPVEDWAALQQRGGLEGSIAWLPIEQIAKVLIQLYQQREMLKAEIYELTGISDLLRGNTNANETATAQQIKGNFGELRLTPRQAPMQRFVRDIFRIKAEIIAEHFTPEHLQLISGQQVPPEVIQLLRDDKIRSLTVDVETDSTVQPDEQAEKQNVTEFMSATSEYLMAAVQIAGAAPQFSPMLFEIFKAGARRFKMGRELEDVIEQTAQQIQQAAQQPPPPDPKQEAEQAKAQAAQFDAQTNMQQSQMEMMAAREKHQMEMERLKEQRITDMIKLRSQRKQSNGNGEEDGGSSEDDGAEMEMFGSIIAAMMQGQKEQTQALIQALTAPKEIIRGPDGRAQAVAPARLQ